MNITKKDWIKGSGLFVPMTLMMLIVAKLMALSLSRIVVLFSAICLFSLMALRWETTKNLFKEFFNAADHPMNLAIFRIVFFYNLFKWIHIKRALNYSQLSRDMIKPPTGVEWMIPFLPLHDTFVIWACIILTIACFLAMIGLWTRVATVLVAVLGLYVLTIPQLFGKVTHYHYLFWFAVIFATSRCGDFLSIDAIRASWKRADNGVVQAPLPHKAYALPLRFIWLLIGAIYFFPGFWKIWGMGFYWALSDNIIYQMYMKWFEFEGWLPAFRIDHYPILYKASALGTVIFEMGFIILIFFPALRYVPVIGGLLFHNLTHLFMKIRFMALQICYVSFFNWHVLFNRLGRFMFPKDMYVLYDGNCELCRRTIASLQVLDLFGRIVYVNALDKNQVKEHHLLHLDEESLAKDMHAVVGDSVYKGFEAYRALLYRFPVFWIIIPLLYVWPVTAIGRSIYRKVADSRTCRVPLKDKQESTLHFTRLTYNLKGVIIAGVLFLTVNTGFGFAGHVNAWPFACFPTFAFKGKRTAKTLEIEAKLNSGKTVSFNAHMLNDKFGSANVRGLVRNIIYEKDRAKQKDKLFIFWQNFVEMNPQLKDVESFHIYQAEYSIVPEDQGKKPLKREMIYK